MTHCHPNHSDEEELRRQAEDGGEMLDLLDEKGRVVGRVKRSDAHGNPALRHPSVHIIVVNAQGEYFLQKRSAYKKIQPGKWDTSVGGHIPAGESYEQGALRELKEELGISLPDASDLKFHHEFVWQSPVETEHTHTYILRYEGPFRLNPAEISEGRFWTVEELRGNVGKGIFTTNLEAELQYLGII